MPLNPINDYMLQVITRDVGPGLDVNQGLYRWFKLDPLVLATTLSEAEQDWVALRAPIVSDVTDELWFAYLSSLGYIGTNDDMKLMYWRDLALGGGVRVVFKEFTGVWAQFSVSSVGYRLSPLAGSMSPDNTFAGGSFSQVASRDDDLCYVVTGSPLPGIVGPLSLVQSTSTNPEEVISMVWDGIDRYAAHVAGIYAQMQTNISLPVRFRLYGDKP